MGRGNKRNADRSGYFENVEITSADEYEEETEEMGMEMM